MWVTVWVMLLYILDIFFPHRMCVPLEEEKLCYILGIIGHKYINSSMPKWTPSKKSMWLLYWTYSSKIFLCTALTYLNNSWKISESLNIHLENQQPFFSPSKYNTNICTTILQLGKIIAYYLRKEVGWNPREPQLCI